MWSSVHWQDIAAMAVIWSALTAALAWMFRPALDRSWLGRFTRNKDTIRAHLNGWYEIKPQRDAFAKLQTDHADLYKRLGELVTQSEDNYEKLGSRIEKAMAEQAEAMKALAREANATAQGLAHLYGVTKVNPWDGTTERRSGDRRHD